MGHEVVPAGGATAKADPLQDTTFDVALATISETVAFRWKWAENEIQQLISTGWDRISEGELRYTFSSAGDDERNVNVFAAAHEQIKFECGPALRLETGRNRSAIWVDTNLLLVLTPNHVRLVKPISGRRSEETAGEDPGDNASGEVCDCHCHCEANGLEQCNYYYDCGDGGFDCDAEEDEDHDCDDEECERERCDGCHCCTCWKNCGCGFYDDEDCGCGCYGCSCDCDSAALAMDDQSGDIAPVTVANQWPAFTTGLTQVLARLDKGEGLVLTVRGHRYMKFRVQSEELVCEIAGKLGVPAEYHLDADQNTRLSERGWYQYPDFGRTRCVPCASRYDEYVETAESVVTVLRDFLGITAPGELGIETTDADGTPILEPRGLLEVITAPSFSNAESEQAAGWDLVAQSVARKD